jgi:hypothetical protein
LKEIKVFLSLLATTAAAAAMENRDGKVANANGKKISIYLSELVCGGCSETSGFVDKESIMEWKIKIEFSMPVRQMKRSSWRFFMNTIFMSGTK